MTKVAEYFSNAGVRIFLAIAYIMIGIVVIKFITLIVKRLLLKTKLQTIVISFATSLLKFVLYFSLAVIIANHIGIKSTSFVAIATALSLAVSLALKDILANVASGLIMISTKPFKEGDFVEINGVSGTIKSISMIRTKMLTVDNKVISIPNGQITNSNIINFNGKNTRRLDISISVTIGEDIEKIKKLLGDVQQKYVDQNLILMFPSAPFVRLSSINGKSISFSTKSWVNASDYWDVYHSMLEDFYKTLMNNNVELQETIKFSLNENANKEELMEESRS